MGFWVVDGLCEKYGLSLKKPWFSSFLFGKGEDQGSRFYLAKPLTYMNRSGRVVDSILARSGLPQSALLVVCDSLDLPVGVVRLKRRGSSGGHNGLKSLIAHLESEDFMRLALGIGRPKDGEDVISHVLGVPEDKEQEALSEAVARSVEGIGKLLFAEPESVMNEINRS